MTEEAARLATRRYARQDGPGRWAAFERNDPKTGAPTFFSRLRRVRDPAGRYHPVRSRDGTTRTFPNMLNVEPEYGESGQRAGPRILFYGLRQASYRPKLQGHWDACVAAGAVRFEEFLMEEYREALGRKAEGSPTSRAAVSCSGPAEDWAGSASAAAAAAG